MPEFNGALDRWLEPPYESERDALYYERIEEAALAEVRGERCAKCGGKTEGSIDNGKLYVVCLDEACEEQRSDSLIDEGGSEDF